MPIDQALLEDLFGAYFDARRNKRNTISALAFELQFESNLFALCEAISARTYEVSPSICFVAPTPVRREIFAAEFRDRIVHHLVFNWISPLFEKRFIVDTYSCRMDKGTQFGINRVRRFLSQCSGNYTRDAYVMKLDIEGYFMRMDRHLLYQEVARVVGEDVGMLRCEPDTLDYLLRQIIFNDPTQGCRIRGGSVDWDGLPASKSLFTAPAGKGLPIGNLTSQLFGNVYLDALDHFIKESLGMRYYGRYVDDLVLVHHDREQLLECREQIARFLNDECDLRLHPRKFFLQHYTKGVPFLGVFIKPHRIYPGKRVKAGFYRVARDWNRRVSSDDSGIRTEELLDYRARVNSYLGLMSHCNSHRLREKVMRQGFGSSFRRHFLVPSGLDRVLLRMDRTG